METLVFSQVLLGLMLLLVAYLAYRAHMDAREAAREARASADKTREIEMLVAASLTVAREILAEVKKT